MKITILKVIAASLLLGSCSLAQAAAISFTDEVTPAQTVLIDIFNPAVQFTHDIIDDGYNPATDTLISAELTLFVRDDFRTELPPPIDPPNDPMVVALDGVFDKAYEVNMADIVISVAVSTLVPDGILTVTLGLPANPLEDWDWAIGGSTLRVVGERDMGSVPLPGTPLLLIGGLLVLLQRQLKSDSV